MKNQDALHDLYEKTSNLFAGSTIKEDLEQQFRALVQSQLHKLELVSRDEFDAQSAVLARTRDKLDALEQQLTELEKQFSGS